MNFLLQMLFGKSEERDYSSFRIAEMEDGRFMPQKYEYMGLGDSCHVDMLKTGFNTKQEAEAYLKAYRDKYTVRQIHAVKD